MLRVQVNKLIPNKKNGSADMNTDKAKVLKRMDMYGNCPVFVEERTFTNSYGLRNVVVTTTYEYPNKDCYKPTPDTGSYSDDGKLYYRKFYRCYGEIPTEHFFFGNIPQVTRAFPEFYYAGIHCDFAGKLVRYHGYFFGYSLSLSEEISDNSSKNIESCTESITEFSELIENTRQVKHRVDANNRLDSWE